MSVFAAKRAVVDSLQDLNTAAVDVYGVVHKSQKAAFLNGYSAAAAGYMHTVVASVGNESAARTVGQEVNVFIG